LEQSAVILLTGANGQVGHELRTTLAPLGPVVASTRETLDLTDEAAIRAAVRAAAPRVIVNAAAYTAVDAAERDAAACAWLNTGVPRILAEEAERCGAWLVHYSTDYVFDGTGRRPYREDDPVAPLGVYGRTKADGEVAVRAACARHVILRVAWVYGLRGKNFLLTIQRLVRERAVSGEPLRVVHDQVGVPTWSRSIAEATAAVVQQLCSRTDADTLPGTYHMAGAGSCSWYDFACAIVQQMGEAAPGVTVQPITTHEYPTPARRPAYSVLDPSLFEAVFGVALPEWRVQLEACVHEDPHALTHVTPP
jgi:dTDP-4-dehydrorhamnose reductase